MVEKNEMEMGVERKIGGGGARMKGERSMEGGRGRKGVHREKGIERG